MFSPVVSLIIDILILILFPVALFFDIRRGASGWSAFDAAILTSVIYSLPRDIANFKLWRLTRRR